jgi:hypothetical protein
MAKFGFDVSEVEVGGAVSRDPIPEGEYVLQALEAEEKPTARGDGSYIKVKYEVVKGEHAGRYVWQNFNINNPSEKAQTIGRQQLVSWATACGMPQADDTDKLIGRSFKAVVAVEPARDTYGPSNKIKVFLFDQAEEKPKAAPAKSPARQNPAAPAAKSANPWD